MKRPSTTTAPWDTLFSSASQRVALEAGGGEQHLAHRVAVDAERERHADAHVVEGLDLVVERDRPPAGRGRHDDEVGTRGLYVVYAPTLFMARDRLRDGCQGCSAGSGRARSALPGRGGSRHNGIFSFADILFGASLTYARLFQGGDRVLNNNPKTEGGGVDIPR